MKIRTYKYISDEKYFVNIRNEDFSENDLQLMQKFGEPELNVGGIYGGVAQPTWALPDKYTKIKQGFQPFVIFFDARTFGEEADNRAIAYLTAITTRIGATILALRQLQDNYTSEIITNV